MFVARRRNRTRTPAALAVVAVLALGPAAWSRLSYDEARAAAVTDQRSASATVSNDGAAEAPAPVSATPVFANVQGLDLNLMSRNPVLVAYHEASLPEALALEPSGHLVANDNTTKFQAMPDAPGPDYVVLSSRGRPHPAASATDVVMREGDPVRSPVTGRVIEVRQYALYGRHADTRIEIAPLDRPDLRVVLIHVAGVAVETGDEVVAGETLLAATANQFPFSSHVDRYTEPERHPHVHLEVKYADRAR